MLKLKFTMARLFHLYFTRCLVSMCCKGGGEIWLEIMIFEKPSLNLFSSHQCSKYAFDQGWNLEQPSLCSNTSYFTKLYHCWHNNIRCNNLYIIIILHVYIAPEPGNPVLRRCTILLPLTQTCFYISQCPREHTTHAATTKLYSKLIAISSSFSWMVESVTSMKAFQLPEPRTRDPSAASPTL